MESVNGLRIFYADITALREELEHPRMWKLLCSSRQKKITQCKNEDDRLRAFGAGLLLEYGLRMYGYTQVPDVGEKEHPYEQVTFSYGENGKPLLVDAKGQNSKVHFNLSHSGTYVAAAFDEKPVGVDVECLRDGKQKVARRFFSEEEKRYLEQCWSDSAFTGIWTRKEAYIKAVGTGIAMPLPSFSTMEEWVEDYALKTWEIKPDVWLSVCRRGKQIECIPEEIPLWKLEFQEKNMLY